jgi:hypothetical protein
LDDPWPGDGAEAVHEPEVADPPRRRTMEATTVAVVAILAAAGGFIGGAAWKGSDSPAAAQSVVAGNGATAATGTNGAANRTPGFGGYGRGGFRGGDGGTGGAFGRNGAVGEITAIDGDRITIKDAQGDEVVVTTSSDTTFAVDQEGTISDLAPGDTVVVQGERGTDGTIAATTIRSGPLGGFGGLGGGPGGAPAATPTT